MRNLLLKRISKNNKEISLMFFEGDLNNKLHIKTSEDIKTYLSQIFKYKFFNGNFNESTYFIKNNYVELSLFYITNSNLDNSIYMINTLKKFNLQKPIIAILAIDFDYTLIKKLLCLGVNNFVYEEEELDKTLAFLDKTLYESILFLTEETEYFNIMQETFSILGHQWKTPLSQIGMIISSFELDIELNNKEYSEKDIERFDKINKQIVILEGLVSKFKNILTHDSSLSKFNLYNSIQEISNLYDYNNENIILRKKHLPIHKEININLNNNDIELSNFELKGVQIDIDLIFQELFNNAIENCSNEKLDIDLSFSIDPRYIIINYKDNAGGIEENTICNIFKPFFSTHSLNNKGFGLYLIKVLVERKYHGIIDVNSINNNTSFIIKFPKNLFLFKNQS
jgi:signal transduction histidine kinase